MAHKSGVDEIPFDRSEVSGDRVGVTMPAPPPYESDSDDEDNSDGVYKVGGADIKDNSNNNSASNIYNCNGNHSEASDESDDEDESSPTAKPLASVAASGKITRSDDCSSSYPTVFASPPSAGSIVLDAVAAPLPTSCSDLIESFQDRRLAFTSTLAACERNCKHNLIVDFFCHNYIQKQNITSLLNKIRGLEGESDFEVIILIRFIYTVKQRYAMLTPTERIEIDAVVEEITSVLKDYVFWPRNKDIVPERNRADKIVFWSENHILMMLGSCHLFQQFHDGLVEDVNSKLLLKAESKDDSNSNSNSKGEGKGVVSDDNNSSSTLGLHTSANRSLSEKGSVLDQPLLASGKNYSELKLKYDSDLSSVSLKGRMESKERSFVDGDAASGASEPNLETKLLKIYLRAHNDFHGEYECCSHVYIPYSMCALMNIYDFSDDPDVKSDAKNILERMACHILACTSDTGVANLSASSRAFLRTRLKISGHNINHLIRFLTNISVDKCKPTVITGFLATTSWVPSEDVYLFYREYNKMITIPLTHSVSETKAVYAQANRDLFIESLFRNKQAEASLSRAASFRRGSGISNPDPIRDNMFADSDRPSGDTLEGVLVPSDELVPFYWSAGLILHPDFVQETNSFKHSRMLTNNAHLKLFSWLPDSLVESLSKSYSHFSSGQVYAGATLNSYKSTGGLVLSSFSNWDGGVASYQQLHWIANVSGVGVWSQSGNGTEGYEGTAIGNTHSPYLKQSDNVIVVAYSTPAAMRSILIGNILGKKVRMFWPHTEFDEMIPSDIDTSKKKKKKKKKRDMFKSFLNSIGTMFVGGDSEDPSKIKDRAWWVARKDRSYIGVMCTSESSVDLTPSTDATQEYSGVKRLMARRVCFEADHAWVVAVGTVETYPTIQDFRSYCSSIVVSESTSREVYQVEAKVPLPNGTVKNIYVKCK